MNMETETIDLFHDLDIEFFGLKEKEDNMNKIKTALQDAYNTGKNEKAASWQVLPKRVFQSPLVEFANFEDGSFVNLIKLFKPYADGTCYAVYETTKSAFCSSGMFKSYDKAKEKFELMVKNGSKESPLKKRGLTGN